MFIISFELYFKSLLFIVQRFRSRSRSTTPPHWKQEQRRAIPLSEAEKIAERRWSKGETVEKPERKKEFDRGRNAPAGRFDRGRGDPDTEDDR